MSLNSSTCKRSAKGTSLIEFPSNYTVIDLETSGLDPELDWILEVAALRIRDGKVVESFQSLINPCPGYCVDEYITALTGITTEMLQDARAPEYILPRYFEFLGDDILVGHNVNFDINFLYDEKTRLLDLPLCNNFVDTMRLSRRLLKDLPHHRLSDLSTHYGVSYSNAHRAFDDCSITNSVFAFLNKEAVTQHGSVSSFIDSCSRSSKEVRAKEIVASETNIDPSNPFYGKVCVFTGTLNKMTRREAMQIIADFGGINADSLVKKTNYLILGRDDYHRTEGGKSRKRIKAEELQLKGSDILILSEYVFYDMVEACRL